MKVDKFLKSSENIWVKINTMDKIEFNYFPDLNMKDSYDPPFYWVINGWIRELNYLIKETKYCLNYSKIYNEELLNNGVGLLEFHRNLYIYHVLNNLFSFLDKVSILICDLLEIETLNKKKDRYSSFSFSTLYNQFDKNKLTFKNIGNSSITCDNFDAIKTYINKLYFIKNNNRIFKFRNNNIHKNNLGINNFACGTFKIIYNKDSNGNITKSYEPSNEHILYNELLQEIENVIKKINAINSDIFFKMDIFI